MANTKRIVTGYTEESDWRGKENANTRKSVSGLYSMVAHHAFAEENLSTLPHGDLHVDGSLYAHDLGYPIQTVYCVGHDLFEILEKGISTAGGTKSKPAKHLDTAVDHIVNFLCMAQNECAGAQSFSNVSTLLAPFVRADRLSYAETKQAIQRMVFSLNYENRIAFQQSFTNFTLDMKPAIALKDTPALVGGQPQDYTYGELQREIELINLAFFEIYLEGDGAGRLFSFPIPTLQITDYSIFDSTDVNNKFWELVAKWGTPYFANFIGTNLDPGATRSMCCRLNLNAEDAEQPHGLWAIGSKTGSLAVSTINLNRLGYEANSPTHFYELLGAIMEKAREQLKYRRNRVEEGRVKHRLLPIFSEYVGTERTFFLTVGICGMNECCKNLFNKSISSCEDFVLETLKFMKDRLRTWKAEDGFLYNLEQTPAETAAYVMAKKDRELYPNCFVSTGPNDVPFLTNSTHEPMYNGRTLLERLEWTAKTDKFYSGGTILHIWLHEQPNIPAVKALVRAVLTYNIPYFTITPTVTHCGACGKVMYGIKERCSYCKSDNVEPMTRVVGYYAPISRFNPGQAEQHGVKIAFDKQVGEVIDENKGLPTV